MITALEAWQRIITDLSEFPREFKTVPKIQRDPLWFNAYTDGQYIYIANAIKEKPSCKITTKRKIIFKDFETVYSYYSIWLSGKVGVRDEVRQKSRNTAYIFALISNLCDKND